MEKEIEQTKLEGYKVECPYCKKELTSLSAGQLNSNYATHIKSCKQRNHNQGEITSGDSESFKRNQHPDALNEENKND